MSYIYTRGVSRTVDQPLRESFNNINTGVKCGYENTQYGSLFKMRNYTGYVMRTNGSLFEMTNYLKELKYHKVNRVEKIDHLAYVTKTQ